MVESQELERCVSDSSRAPAPARPLSVACLQFCGIKSSFVIISETVRLIGRNPQLWIVFVEKVLWASKKFLGFRKIPSDEEKTVGRRKMKVQPAVLGVGHRFRSP